MKRYSLIIVLVSIMGLTGCKDNVSNASEDVKPETEVSLTHVSHGNIESKLELLATTAYLKHTSIVSPTASYITAVNVQQGQIVRRGQTVFNLESKEYKALEGIDNQQPRYGKMSIKSPVNGIILDVQQQCGSYVPEGTVLATEVNLNSLVYKIDVPYEDIKYARTGSKCIIVLPDNRHLSARISAPLVSMNTVSQSQQIIARAQSPFLPEGMNVKVIIKKSNYSRNMQILPREAVQSNEDMTKYWVMKLIGKDKAVKVPVTIGNNNNNYIEIASPKFSDYDNIILTGAYALDDGATVKVKK
ncbi:MAG: HlyD family efflux transporter periplasmic adaptor subunit [Prevotella sp.]|nr:HlyD family efflux transporter periplasmic adaptor subunit [Prevotella sp.]